jgi:hypothetical protein
MPGVKEQKEMTIGRTDDPDNPLVALACEVASMFGAGSRTPSGQAVMLPRQQGRTHDRNRPTRQISRFFSCIPGAVHTCNNAPRARSYQKLTCLHDWRNARYSYARAQA